VKLGAQLGRGMVGLPDHLSRQQDTPNAIFIPIYYLTSSNYL